MLVISYNLYGNQDIWPNKMLVRDKLWVPDAGNLGNLGNQIISEQIMYFGNLAGNFSYVGNHGNIFNTPPDMVKAKMGLLRFKYLHQDSFY